MNLDCPFIPPLLPIFDFFTNLRQIGRSVLLRKNIIKLFSINYNIIVIFCVIINTLYYIISFLFTLVYFIYLVYLLK